MTGSAASALGLRHGHAVGRFSPLPDSRQQPLSGECAQVRVSSCVRKVSIGRGQRVYRVCPARGGARSPLAARSGCRGTAVRRGRLVVSFGRKSGGRTSDCCSKGKGGELRTGVDRGRAPGFRTAMRVFFRRR